MAAVAAAAAVAQMPFEPADVARLFVNACLRHDGQAGAAVDWALAQGFRPLGDLPDAVAWPALLGDAAGSVLAPPGSRGAVLLATTAGGRCSVWAHRQPGPALRLALMRELDVLAKQGARVRVQAERNVAHDGQWRNVMQWRYRGLGATAELELGAATTLGDAPAEQALDLAPAPPDAPR